MMMKSREKVVVEDRAPPGTVELVDSMGDAVEANRAYWKVAEDSVVTARLVREADVI